MTEDEIKERFGPDYPALLTDQGKAGPLHKETRFRRIYKFAGHQVHISRFMDGSAAISLDQLMQEWPTWKSSLRHEFCMGLSWLKRQPDFPGMVRFLMQVMTVDEVRAIALEIASTLPQDEAFAFLARTLEKIPHRDSANITQAIARTKDPQAEQTLREHLAQLWSDADLWHNADFMNWTAYSTLCCLKHLLELGVSPHEFEEHTRKLASHPCAGLRDSCQRFLSPHYTWLPSHKEERS